MTNFLNLNELGGKVPSNVKIQPDKCHLCGNNVEQIQINDTKSFMCDIGHIESCDNRTARLLSYELNKQS